MSHTTESAASRSNEITTVANTASASSDMTTPPRTIIVGYNGSEPGIRQYPPTKTWPPMLTVVQPPASELGRLRAEYDELEAKRKTLLELQAIGEKQSALRNQIAALTPSSSSSPPGAAVRE